MVDKHSPLPMWLAPLAGPIAGGFLGLTATGGRGPNDISPVAAASVGAGIGFVAGLIIFIVDWRRKRQQPHAPAMQHALDDPDSAPPSGVVRLGMIVFATIVVVSGITLLTVKLGELQTARRSAAWPSTTGRMSRVDAVEEMSGKRNSSPKYILLCTYRYKVGDVMYEGTRWRFGGNTVSKDDADQFKDEHRLGSEVQVYYDPENPEESTLVAGAPTSLYAAIILAPVLVIGGAIGLYVLIFKN